MAEPDHRQKILFLCTGNSCRSQMAQAWTREIHGERFEVYSAGIEPREVDPRAVQVMAEVGVDMRAQRSKHVDELADVEFDYVVTVCDNAREHCPFFPAKVRVLHKSFDDPPYLARDSSSEDEALEHYRRIRDEISVYIETLPQLLHGEVEKDRSP